MEAFDQKNLPVNPSSGPPLVQEVISINVLQVLSMSYHALNLPLNIAFMILTLIGLDDFSLEYIYWMQIASFVHMGVSLVTWLLFSFIPYVLHYFVKPTVPADFSDH